MLYSLIFFVERVALPSPKPQPLVLTDTVQDALTLLVRRHSTPQQIALRAQIVLLAHQGIRTPAIARQLGISLDMVRHWRHRWRALQDTPEAEMSLTQRLADAPRPGAPATISAEAYCQIMALACQPPEECGRPIAQWTARELAAEAIAQGFVESISPRQVGRFLKGGRPQTAFEPLLAHTGRGPGQRPEDRSGLSVV